MATGSIVERGARFVRTMILTRLLAPEHLGMMALIMAASQFLEALTEVGVRQCVIQHKKGDTREFLNAAWWFSGIRGIGLYLLGFLATPWLASFYNEPELTKLLKVAFLTMIFQGLTSPGLYVLEKKLKFGLQVLVIQGSGLVGTIISLILAFIYPNVWALVAGFVAEFLFRCLGSFFVYPFRPTLTWDRESLLSLFRFTRGIFGLPILTYLFLKADIFVIGRIFNKQMDILGYYAVALMLAEMPNMIFTRIAGPLVLPALSTMQDQFERMKNNLLRMTHLLFLFGIPLATVLFIFAHPILFLVYGEAYSKVSGAFAVLNIYTLLFMAGVLIANVYIALGRPELHRKFTIIRILFLAILIYPAVEWWDVTGVATTRVLSIIFAGFFQLSSLKHVLQLSVMHYIYTAREGIVLSLILFIPALLCRYGLESQILQLSGGAVLCILMWLMGIHLLRRRGYSAGSGTSTATVQ